MITDIIENTESHMKKCTEAFETQIKRIHVGRISPNILDNIKIKNRDKETYTPLRYLASIITENASTLVITVFDSSMVTNIEKNIINSDLNLNTSSKGNIIRVHSPILTEERRQQFIKLIRNDSEKTKIFIRNIRRSVNEQIKKSIKNKTINEDKERHLQNKIQILTNAWIKKINEIVEKKEMELKKF